MTQLGDDAGRVEGNLSLDGALSPSYPIGVSRGH